jgi:plasmid stabilization system protein ParE
VSDSFTIFFTDEALNDIHEFFIWYKSIHPKLALNFEMELEKEIVRLNKNPFLFSRRYKKIQIVFLRRFPIGIHYVIYGNDIKVIAVFHTSKSPVNWDQRL